MLCGFVGLAPRPADMFVLVAVTMFGTIHCDSAEQEALLSQRGRAVRGVNPSTRLGEAQSRRDLRGPGAEPLVWIWGRSSQKLKDITELNSNSECIDVY